MFSKKKKVELDAEEIRILFHSLNDFRNALLEEGKYADIVNEVMVKIKTKMKVDKYDLGIMINGLDKKRKAMLDENQDTADIDNLLLRLLNISKTIK